MSRIVFALFLASAWLDAHAQSSLPPCPGDFKTTTWTSCFGTFTLPDGDKYVGEFREGKFHGKGTYTWADGNYYIGEFRDDLRNGQGTNTFASGSKYVGEFRDGNYHGQGTYTWADGRKYVGEFQNDKSHGRGTLYNVNGTVFSSGMWRDDQFLPSGDTNANTATLLAEAVKKCRDLGFKEKTEKFGRCVLELSK
jgi:hypothetical protein